MTSVNPSKVRILSRRKRQMLIVLTGGFIFLVTVSLFIWYSSRAEKPYSPGENIKGLTAKLTRSIPLDYPEMKFTDATSESGIDFQHFSGKRTTQLPEDMGSGAAWEDFNNDGWLDLFVVNEVGPLTLTESEKEQSSAYSKLFQNQQDGTFREINKSAGIDQRGWGMAAAWGDYNNDGWSDLFISGYGKNVLYRNNGNGTFTDKSKEAGINSIEGFWTGVSWGDFNRDGYLDIYVCGYVQYSYIEVEKVSLQYRVEVPVNINPSSFEPERNLLFQNNGNGTFTEIAEFAGVDNPLGRSLSASWCDFDEDGWVDLYVANDVSDNALFRNLGNNKFEEISLSAWVADYRGAMGIGVGDWDNDMDMDIFITHWIAQENALYSNLYSQFMEINSPESGGLKFMDEADRFGLGQIALDYVGWGTSFFDYNNDGLLDLYVVNGSTFQQNENPRLLTPMTDQLFWNRGPQEGYYDVSLLSGDIFSQQFVGRGAAFGDYDNDGDVDIFIVNNGGPGKLLRNECKKGNQWLKVNLIGTESNREAIGARLRLVTGETVQIRQVGSQSSYLSQNSLIQHFGMNNRSIADTLKIIWPVGTKQVLVNILSNQTVKVVEGKEPIYQHADQ